MGGNQNIESSGTTCRCYLKTQEKVIEIYSHKSFDRPKYHRTDFCISQYLFGKMCIGEFS